MCCPLWVLFVVLQHLFSANQWQLSLKMCGNTPVRKQKTTRYFWRSFIAYFETRFWDEESRGPVRTEKAGQWVLSVSTFLLCLCVIPSVRAMPGIAQLEKRDGAFGGICYVTPTVLLSCQTLVPVSWVSETCSTGTVHLPWVMLLKAQGMALAAAVSRTVIQSWDSWKGAAWEEGAAMGQGRPCLCHLFLRYWLKWMEANCRSNKFHSCPALVCLLVWVISMALPGSHKAFWRSPCRERLRAQGAVVGAGGVLAACCPGVPARLVVVWQDSAAVNAV